jgi:membrane protein YdbS with pleckstrin-like domain
MNDDRAVDGEPAAVAAEMGVAAAPAPGAERVSTAPSAAADPLLGHERKLDRNWITRQRIGRWIGVAVLAMAWAMASLIVALVGPPAVVYAAVVGGLGALVVLKGVLAQVWPAKAWRYASYRVTGRGIEIRRGVWWREAVAVPRSRVQHTDVIQGPLERALGLGTLVLYTAGTDHSRVALPGLAYGDALAIRDRLAAVDEDDAV